MLDSLDTLIAFTLIFTVVSLLVTIVVQMISSALNLRGHNLCCALADTFEVIDPGLKARTKTLADKLLRDPLLSDKQMLWRTGLASAVRPDELFEALHRIATGPDATDKTVQQLKDDAKQCLLALGVDENYLKAADATAKQAQDIITTVLKTAGVNDDARKKEISTGIETALHSFTQTTAEKVATVSKIVGATSEEAKGLLTIVLNTVKGIADETQKKTIMANLEKALNVVTQNASGQVVATAKVAETMLQLAYRKFESRLSTGQERAQEWFTMHARLTTLIVGAIFAFWLQLDTIEIFKTTSSNKAVRDKLVAQTSVVLGQSEKVLVAQKSTVEKSYDAWLTKQSDVIKKALADPKPESLPTDTPEAFRKKIRDRLIIVPELKQDVVEAALGAFDAAIKATVADELKAATGYYESVKTDLDKTGFSLFPPEGGRWGEGWDPTCLSFRNWLGMIFSTLLLSLGAPFWFNTLKSLASLRSAVAGNIDQEEKAAKKPADQKPSPLPPTVISPGVG